MNTFLGISLWAISNLAITIEANTTSSSSYSLYVTNKNSVFCICLNRSFRSSIRALREQIAGKSC